MENKEVPENNSNNAVQKKKRQRRRKKKGNGADEDPSKLQNNNDNKDNLNNSKKTKSRRKRDDRYYGRFNCGKCRRNWDSAHVYTIGGTKKVKYKQCCKVCRETWVFPYHIELLMCSQCNSRPCRCTCEECGKLKHKRYIIKKTDNPDEPEVEIVDPNFKYCRCEGGKDIQIGANIDVKKNHIADLCQKCLKGRPCGRRMENNSEENEQ
ncbi:zygote arrest protein 2.L-like [Physella acuta]|uniref:zygote arrest protein 2.L-like n=1 Tax=Physella acuta TaxID=109671 RepID=UPI0027DC58BE|nr:zygote arrest protein 2.L-like [Physella acuta]